MLLNELFDQMTYGELSGLSIGGLTEGGIDPSSYPQLVSYVNLALIEVHKRFPLRVKSADIVLDENVSTYSLQSKYGIASTSSETYKYIQDTVDNPFIDSVLKLEYVLDADGEQTVLDDETDDAAYITESEKSFYVPDPVTDTAIKVFYRASHEKLNPMGIDPYQTELDIPLAVITPMLYFIASRAYASTPTIEGVSQSDRYLKKYEIACAEVDLRDLVVRKTYPKAERIERNGWV